MPPILTTHVGSLPRSEPLAVAWTSPVPRGRRLLAAGVPDLRAANTSTQIEIERPAFVARLGHRRVGGP